MSIEFDSLNDGDELVITGQPYSVFEVFLERQDRFFDDCERVLNQEVRVLRQGKFVIKHAIESSGSVKAEEVFNRLVVETLDGKHEYFFHQDEITNLSPVSSV